MKFDRGTLVSDADTKMMIVWSISLGIAHCIPIREAFHPDSGCVALLGQLTTDYRPSKAPLKFAAASERRHLPVEAVHPFGRLHPCVVADIEAAIYDEQRGLTGAGPAAALRGDRAPPEMPR